MPVIQEGNLLFQFANGWDAEQYDVWTFYVNQFQQVCGGCKAVDILAISPNSELWLIEAKDYRGGRRTKPSDLADEIAAKVRDTLAALLAAAVNANLLAEPQFARRSLGAGRLRVVLHLEQPAKHSKLFPRAINPANVTLKLKQLLNAIDPHPVVSEIANLARVPWTVV